jgi:hypothetical protein
MEDRSNTNTSITKIHTHTHTHTQNMFLKLGLLEDTKGGGREEKNDRE